MAGNSEVKGNVGEGIEPKSTVLQGPEQVAAAKSVEDLKAAKVEAAKEVTFYEESKVPEGLKPTFKELQKAYTQKTQEIADVKKRAEAFDQLMQNPNFQDWVQKNVLAEPGEGSPGEEVGLEGSEAFVDEDTAKLTEIEKRQEQLEEELEIDRNMTVLDKLAVKHPDFDSLMPEIAPLVQEGYPYEAAYYQVKFGKPEAEVKKQMRDEILKEIEAEKKARVEGAGTSASMLSPTQAKTVREAYEKARESHIK